MNEKISAFESEGFECLVTMTFDNLTGATRLAIRNAAVDPLNLDAGVKKLSAATIAGSTSIRAIFGR